MADDVKIIDHGIFVKKSGNTKYIINPDLSNATVTTDNGKSYTTLNNALSSLDLAIDHPTIVEGLDKITDESKDGIYFVGNITETYTEEEIANLYSNNISYKLITDTDRNAYKVISEQTNANRYLEHTKLYITDNTSLYFPTDVTYPLYFTSDLTDDKTKCIQKCIDSNNTEYVRTNTGTKDDSGKITWTFGEWKTILQQVIDLAVKTAVLKAKKEAILECRPVGSYFLTETEDDPNILFGGEWKRVKGKILQCSDDKHPAGTDIEAGLPNITGGFGLRPVEGGMNVTWETNNGAIKVATQTDDSSNCVARGSSKNPLMNVTIDASRSNPIYGKSDTVQPPTHVVNAWIRIS